MIDDRDGPVSPPPQDFQLIAAAGGVLADAEIARLIEHCDRTGGEGVLSGGRKDAFRRSRVAWARHGDGFEWLYERLWRLAEGFNAHFFGFELSGIEESVQVARYDADVQGGYEWHQDFGLREQRRKLSISLQLSEDRAYSGGDLEFDVSTEITRVGRERGLAIAFPSFVRHRVAPVTAGARYSLVAWVAGPRWR